MPRTRRSVSVRGLSHLTAEGEARMVDVSTKVETSREAVARGVLRMAPTTLAVVERGNAPKGDVLGVARIAGILAAKRTSELIPMCHPLRITGVEIGFSSDRPRGKLTVEARVRTVDKTGVEMEALTAVSVAALAIYDMIKAVERGVTIGEIQLVEKSGGKSGHWKRPGQTVDPGAQPRAPRPGSPVDEETQPRASRPGHPRFKPGKRSDK